MAIAVQNRLEEGRTPQRSLAPGMILMAVAIFVGALAIVINSDMTRSFPYLYLLPWVLALLIVLIIPTAILYWRGTLTLFDPLVYATWSYFFPAFVLGGLVLASGWSQPHFLSFIEDAEYNLPYTVFLIMLGHIGLTLGYFSPFGVKAGAAIGRYLPTKDFEASALLAPGLVILLLGSLSFGLALGIGVIGYQQVEFIESYSGLIYLTTLFWVEGFFLIWFVLFKRGRFDFTAGAVVAVLALITVAKTLFSGNRSALFQVFVIIMLAFLMAGRKLNFRRTVVAGSVLCVTVVVGMVYGTTFRSVKGTESYASVGEYTSNIFETVDQVGRFDLESSLQLAVTGIADRLDTLSSVAVVVSNYEQLYPYEESYGLNDNIWKDTTTFFIPRVLWNDKPVASDPRKYSELYFNYGENSFAITPMGDLVRNYGPFGVPIGMFFLGIIIRFIYRSLIENQPRTVWRATMYFMLLLSISYEVFYGMLIPFLFKAGLTAVVGLVIVSFVARSLGYSRVEHSV